MSVYGIVDTIFVGRWVGAIGIGAITVVMPITFLISSIGMAMPVLLLTLSKQGFFLIPLILILPFYWGLYGVWFAFPIAEVGAALITFIFLRKETRKLV
ncbi:MAG: Na+-driven multidrug efflux pump [Patiriisocius sp.]|jgi:Na+-driven multidrug efflux pump